MDRAVEVAVLQVVMVHHSDLEEGSEADWEVVYHAPSLNPSTHLQQDCRL